MRAFSPAQYGPTLSKLVEGDRLRPLDAGEPDAVSRAALEDATLEKTFADARLFDRDMGRCCLAGVWLLHDFLDESHAVSQSIETSSGSYWHGVMHRREGDFSNAKYWFRRAGRHAVLEQLGPLVTELAEEQDGRELGQRIAPGGKFDPFAMVDACQAAIRGGQGGDFCRRVQQAEWELLFDHCYRRAVGA